MLPQFIKCTYEDFLKITKEQRAEYIDGEVYLLASPSPEHQRISFKLSMELGSYFRNNECEVFAAPLDVILENEKTREKHVVQPDISIICEKDKFTESNYKGVPTLIIEILSPSTTWIDISKKFDLYQRFGVKEYWIVKPKSRIIEIYYLEDEAYTEPMAYSKDDIVKSDIFQDLSIELKSIF